MTGEWRYRLHKMNPPVSRIRPLSATEAAYLAATIDDEGSIYIRRRPYVRTAYLRRMPGVTTTAFPVITITNTSEDLMRWLSGLSSRPVKHTVKSSEKRIGGPTRTKPCYHFEICRGVDVQAVLLAVLPYMIIKRAKALEALRICEEKFRRYAPLGRTQQPAATTKAR